MFDAPVRKVTRLHIDNIVRLCTEVEREDRENRDDSEDITENFLKDIGNRDSAHVALFEYLLSIDKEMIRYIESIMLLGRDYELELASSAQEHEMSREDFIASDPSYAVDAYFGLVYGESAGIVRDDSAGYISGKAHLREHLANGCRLLGL